MTRPSVALVTAAAARHLDEDLPPLDRALDEASIAHDIVEWDDSSIDWARYQLVVVRSTWDYVPRHAEFLAWTRLVESVTTLANDANTITWNTDKRYLRDLTRLDVPVVPTLFVEPGERIPHLPPMEIVVKPAVSAGANDTNRYATDRDARSEARAHVERLTDAGRTAMIQPYLAGVEALGETALIYIDGEFTHAIRKGAILVPGTKQVEGLYAEEDIRPRTPTPMELEVGQQTIRAVNTAGYDTPMYARVDLVPGPSDDRPADDRVASAPVVLELELTEPSLFFAHADGSASTLAAAIGRRLGLSGDV